MELLSSHGLPEDRREAEYVISKSDFLLAENWDKRFGVGLWDIIMDRIHHDNFNIMPQAFIELISLPANEFNESMREVFAGTKKGKSIVEDIVNNITQNKGFSDIDSKIINKDDTEYFSPEELIGIAGVNETDTTSAGSYAYDAPCFIDDETADHSNMIAKSIKDGLG
jgi:hypothetical protein